MVLATFNPISYCTSNEGNKMAKRLTRKLSEVATEVRATLIKEYGVTEAELSAWHDRALASTYTFPTTAMIPIADLWLDYEVQRDVIHKHIINIMKKWDPRICSPVSACQLIGNERVDAYDGQHRTIAAAILGFGRAAGDTLVALMVAGNAPPGPPFTP